MRAVAERSICAQFAVAKFVVSALFHVESHRSVSSDQPFALSVAERIDLGMAAGAPVVLLASMQIDVGGKDSCVSWHGWRAVSSFFIGPAFWQRHNVLLRKISDIVH